MVHIMGLKDSQTSPCPKKCSLAASPSKIPQIMDPL